MEKLIVNLVVALVATVILAGCASSPQSGGTASTNTTSTSSASTSSAAVAVAPAAPVQPQKSVWVEAPTGSHIGGGFVGRSSTRSTNDEPGLIAAINSINAAETRQREQQFVLRAASQVSGMSQDLILAQQKQMRVRLGELLALNLIARNQPPKVREMINLKAQGKSWTDLARANSISVASVAQTVRKANELAMNSYLKEAQTGGTGTELQLHNQGVSAQPTSIGGARPSGP